MGGKVLGIRLLEQLPGPGRRCLWPRRTSWPSLPAVWRPTACPVPTGSAPSPRAPSPASGWSRTAEARSPARFARRDGTPWSSPVSPQRRCTCTSTAEGAQPAACGRSVGQGHASRSRPSCSARLDKRSSVLCIGVAGEKLVRVASVMHEQAHSLGRGGLGAVFGSKMLKAVSVTSPGPVKNEAQEQFAVTRREVSKLAGGLPDCRPPTTASAPRSWWASLNEAGAFPTDFFTKGAAPHRATLEAEHWPEWATIENDTCPPCPLRCRKRLTLTEGPEAGREIHGPEYETLYAFGGSCMVEHARDVAKLNERCNMLGIDTMSGGNLVAAAIKAEQLGLLEDGPAAGDVEAISPPSGRDRHPVDPHRRPAGRGDGRSPGPSRHERVVDHLQAPRSRRVRAAQAEEHGSELRGERARSLPPARDLLQSGAGRSPRRTSTTTPSSRPTSTGKTVCCCSTASPCAASTGTS